MAAQTIAAQVNQLVGTTTVASLDDWAGDAINRLYRLLPPDALADYGTVESETYNAAAITVKNKRIFGVTRAVSAGSTTRGCRYVSPQRYIEDLADSASMNYPTDWDPVWTNYSDEIVVLPSVSGMIITARTLSFISPATFDTTGTAISVLPELAEYLVVLDLCERVVLALGLALNENELSTQLLTNEDIELAMADVKTIEIHVAIAAAIHQKYRDELKTRYGIDIPQAYQRLRAAPQRQE